MGLGLALAFLAAFLLYDLQQRRDGAARNEKLISRFMAFGFLLALIGAGLEVYKAYEARRLSEAQYLALQTLPEDMWLDVVEIRRQKAFGGAKPTGELLQNVAIDVGEVKEMAVPLKSDECQQYFVIARPPSKLIVMVLPTDVEHKRMIQGDFQATGSICATTAHEAKLDISVSGVRSRATAELYQAPPLKSTEPSAPASQPSAPASKRVICTGEIEGNCPAAHDIYLPCASGSDQQIADNVCRKAGSQNSRRLTVGGNRCGYAIIDVTCS
jgi:hypothetical protein